MVKGVLGNFRLEIVILFLLVNSFFSIAQSENNDELDELKENFSGYFQYTRSVMNGIDKSVREQTGLWGDFYKDKSLDFPVDSQTYSDKEFSLSVSDLGLKWVSDATHNFRPGISESEDMFFRSRVSTGLDWVIFGEGSFKKSKEDLLYFKKRTERDSIVFNYRDNRELQEKFNVLQYVFDKHRLALLQKYLSVLEIQYQHDMKLYENQLINYPDVVKSSQNVEELKNIIKIITDYSSDGFNELLQPKYWDLPFGFTDLPNVNNLSENELLLQEEMLFNLEKELMTMKKKTSDRPSFRARFRYNYYDSENQSNRSFASIGASLSIPIDFRKNDPITEYEIGEKERDLSVRRNELKNDLKERHRRFYLLKNNRMSLERDLVYLLTLMDNEIEVYDQMNRDFSPAKYIDYSKQFLSKKIQILEIQHELCKQYLLFYAVSGLEYNVSDLFEKQNDSEENTQKSTYIWNTFFEENDNERIILMLKKQGIDEVLVSSRNNEKIKNFLELASQDNIKTERLIGENSYARDDSGTDRLILKLKEAVDAGFTGIHLDIEPHTFDDYKENITVYTKRMIRLFDLAHNWCKENSVRLSVSVPMNLPLETAQFLASAKIKTHIMAYEVKNQEKLLERTKKLRTVLEDNYIWVLRVSDFSEEELKEAERFLISQGIDKIGYYELSTINIEK